MSKLFRCPRCGDKRASFEGECTIFWCGTIVNEHDGCMTTSASCHALTCGRFEREAAAWKRRAADLEAYVSKLEKAGDACAETATTPQQMAWRRAKESKP